MTLIFYWMIFSTLSLKYSLLQMFEQKKPNELCLQFVFKCEAAFHWLLLNMHSLNIHMVTVH